MAGAAAPFGRVGRAVLMTLWALLRVLGEAVLLPLATFAVLSAAGVPALWALVGSAATSVLVVADRYRRTGNPSTLGLIVLCRFTAGIIVALVTGDAQLTLAKDPAFTGLVALGALATLALHRPLTARIRRELTADPAPFDDMWRTHSGYRHLHHRLTVVWAVGLLLESGIGFLVVYTAPFTTAVVITRILGPATLIGLSVFTTYRDAAGTRAAQQSRKAADPHSSRHHQPEESAAQID